jgi:hypothetical protein
MPFLSLDNVFIDLVAILFIAYIKKFMQILNEKLTLESTNATEMLFGKVVDKVIRHKLKEVLVEFTDGTRLFIDHSADALELSITEGRTS